jgi:putative flippase GtrA
MQTARVASVLMLMAAVVMTSIWGMGTNWAVAITLVGTLGPSVVVILGAMIVRTIRKG